MLPFPSNHQDGQSGAEEVDLLQVHLGWRVPGPTTGHVLEQQRQLYGACQKQCLSCGLRQKQRSLLKHLRKAKKGAPPLLAEVQGGEDPPEGHDHAARDGRRHGGHVQRQELQLGRD